jgi:hypothetical protein
LKLIPVQKLTLLYFSYNRELVAESRSILVRWRNHFSQLFNVHGVSNVKQTHTHRAEPPLPEPSAFEVEMASEKLREHKSPYIDQIPVELIKAGGRTICSEIHKCITSILNKECKELIIAPIYKKAIKQTNNYRGVLLLLTTIKILSNILLSSLTPNAPVIIGIINVDFNATGHLLIIYSAFVKYLRRNGNTVKQCTALYASRKLKTWLGGKSRVIFSLSLVSPRNW